MLYLRARWYELESGRFISPDTIIPDFQNPQSINKYSYAQNNPLRYTDPSGEWPVCPPEDPCCECLRENVRTIPTFQFVILPILRVVRPTQWFGDTVSALALREDYRYSRGLHAGFDFGAPPGTNVFAGIYGTVVGVFTGADVFRPNYVIIRPAPPNLCESVSRVVLYGHLSPPSVRVGDEVGPVTRIGAIDAAAPGGPHLHLEIRDYEDDYRSFNVNEWFYNPAYYLGTYWMSRLIAEAEARVEDERVVPEGLRFVGERNEAGELILGDPYTQPYRIPR